MSYNSVNVLVTGFEKFLDHPVNPSELIALELDGREYPDYTIHGAILPLRYHEIREKIRQLLDKYSPSVLVMCGLAPRFALNIEKVAINYANSGKTPYNCGTTTNGLSLDPSGPPAYFSSLPISDVLASLKKSDIPARESLTAGSYGCNQVFYEGMRYIDLKKLNTLAGFVHVPMLPEQATDGRHPFMPLEIQIQGIEEVIRVSFSHFISLYADNT